MASPAHRKATGADQGGRALSGRRLALGATAIGVAGAVAIAAVVVATRQTPSASAAGSPRHTVAGTRPAAGSQPGATTTTTTPAPLTVASISPATSAGHVATDSPITVTFSAPLAPGAPTPILTPHVAGQWTESGSTMVFHPSAGYIPSTKIRVTVPAGVAADEHSHRVTLSSAYRSSFAVQTGSVRRLQELLAELGYLPVSFTPASVTTDAVTKTATGKVVTASALAQEPTVASQVRTSSVAGHFAWAYHNVPTSLAALWKPGVQTTMVQGAVMAFEADNGLAVDGIAGPEVWTTLLSDVAARKTDPHAYNYIEVSKSTPETLRVWQDGKVVFSSLANTGVPGADTPDGTWPIYTHEALTRMIGTDVNGSKYNVLVQDVGYFYQGDAVHAYPRASYGFPQSNGCVELPLTAGAQIFNNGENDYGVLVTVSA